MERRVSRIRRRPWPILTLALRFFSGQYLDGQIRQTRGGVVLPAYVNWYWNRWSRGRRAVWRNGVFWPVLGFTIGMMIDMTSTLLAIGYMVVFLLGRLYQYFAKTSIPVLSIHHETVTVPTKPEMEADNVELDGTVQAELGTNLVEIQKLQTPKRRRTS